MTLTEDHTPPGQELKMQSECFTWFWNTYPEQRQMLFHVQNKAKNRIEGAKFKAIGVVRGISDFVLILPQRGLKWIELKTCDGYQSKEQISFQKKVEERGHDYIIIRSISEFKTLIQNEFAD